MIPNSLYMDGEEQQLRMLRVSSTRYYMIFLNDIWECSRTLKRYLSLKAYIFMDFNDKL